MAIPIKEKAEFFVVQGCSIQETVISVTFIVLPVNRLQLTAVQTRHTKMLNANIMPTSWRFVKERRRKGEVVETKSEKEKDRNKVTKESRVEKNKALSGSE